MEKSEFTFNPNAEQMSNSARKAVFGEISANDPNRKAIALSNYDVVQHAVLIVDVAKRRPKRGGDFNG